MVAISALFGVAGGMWPSMVGAVGSATRGRALRRQGETLIARVVSSLVQARGDTLLQRWGRLAILVTQLLPLRGETTMIMARRTMRLERVPPFPAHVAGVCGTDAARGRRLGDAQGHPGSAS